MDDSQGSLGGRSLQLQSAGLTLIGVVLSVGVTVGFGIKAHWAVRVAAGAATVVLLLAAVRVGSAPGRGPLARLARWITRGDEQQAGRD